MTPPFEIGDRVTVIDGPFEGYQATVESMWRSLQSAGEPGEWMARVSVTAFGRSLQVDIPADCLAKGELM